MSWRGARSALLALSLAAAVTASADAQAPAEGAWSPEFRAGLRRTAELRRQRRRVPGGRSAVGAIVPYPMPPSLIIRQTPGTHDEIRDLLRVLRAGP